MFMMIIWLMKEMKREAREACEYGGIWLMKEVKREVKTVRNERIKRFGDEDM